MAAGFSAVAEAIEQANGSTLSELFSNAADPNITVEVNKYIWQASLEVLNFLPVETVDPFTGVFVTGYGRPPGGGRAYRATVYVQDPALDARSLKVALQSQGGGAVAPDTVRAIEDAILTRARQLRQREAGVLPPRAPAGSLFEDEWAGPCRLRYCNSDAVPCRRPPRCRAMTRR